MSNHHVNPIFQQALRQLAPQTPKLITRECGCKVVGSVVLSCADCARRDEAMARDLRANPSWSAE